MTTDMFELADRLAVWANTTEIPADKALLQEAAHAALELSSVRIAEAEHANPRFQVALTSGGLLAS